MFYKDHQPPHFHAVYQKFQAKFDINTLEVINGKLPTRAKILVVEWALEHREELLKNWKRIQTEEQFNKIKPLK